MSSKDVIDILICLSSVDGEWFLEFDRASELELMNLRLREI
jgi:hypothetical protein